MKIGRTKERAVCFLPLFAAAVLLLTPVSVYAGPWQWKMNLDRDPAGGALFMPSAIYVDGDKERYYIVDAGRNLLLSYNKEGEVLNAFNPQNQLKAPFDLGRDQNGDLWVVEKGRNSLTYIDFKGQKTVPHKLSYQGKDVFPDRFEIDGADFYVLDKISGAVLKYDQGMKVVQRLACGADCAGGFVDFKLQAGEVWTLAMREKTIYRFSSAGEIVGKIALGDAVDFPASLAITDGLIYVLDRHRGDVTVLDAEGRFKYRFLGRGHVRGQLYFPVEIKFDPWGRLCVVDEGNGRVQVFDR